MVTKPRKSFPKDTRVNPALLAAGRYGTPEMVAIWGAEKTFEYSLRAQGQAALTLSRLYPHLIPEDVATEIFQKASLDYIDADRIRDLEEQTGHDVIAINTALGEVLSDAAKPHVNKAKTSADTTQPARALQLKASLEVLADSVENLRDITLEKAVAWKDVPCMDTTHLYDAVPSVVGRAFAHYAEVMQSGLDFLGFVYKNSIKGKWADATGNHHGAVTLGIDGISLQKEYCTDLGVGFMDAPAQVPGLEFEADMFFVMARLGETMNNLARYVAWGRSDDVNIFVNANPKRKKGSAGMPHKDAKNGNPVAEEQMMSIRNYLMGNLVTGLANCEMPYARNLAASSNARINFEDGFKFMDHGIRRLASVVYHLGLQEERSVQRVLRTYGVVTSPQVLTYLTSLVDDPLPWREAHDLVGSLASVAWKEQRPFTEVLLAHEAIRSRLDESTIRRITDPLVYIGDSKRIITTVFDKYHQQSTLNR